MAGPSVRAIPGEASPRDFGASCCVSIRGAECPEVRAVGKPMGAPLG